MVHRGSDRRILSLLLIERHRDPRIIRRLTHVHCASGIDLTTVLGFELTTLETSRTVSVVSSRYRCRIF